ncbi:MAG: hypothetical protein HY265_01305, partial [Deltaproteobacteria bacterium]|nr:hypothetical protein [Deltaproteobacteria bacterium]
MRDKIETRDNPLNPPLLRGIRKSGVKNQLSFSLMLTVCCLLVFAAISFSEEKGGIRTVAVITGDEIMGKFKQPSGLFFDEAKKRLYIADSGNGRLVSFDAEFKYLAELTNDVMTLPVSLVRNKEGHFFILDSGKGEIIFIDLEKKVAQSFPLSNVPSGKEQFLPGRMAIDTDNRLYIIDKLNRRLIVVEQTGAFVREIAVKDKGFFGFTDVRVDDKGEIYAIDAIAGVVYIFDNK